MILVYLPGRGEFFLWRDGRGVGGPHGLASLGKRATAVVVAPGRRGDVVEGLALPLFETMARLAVTPTAEIPALPASIATWTLASKLALDLVSRERVVPTVVRRRGKIEARWGAALAASQEVQP